MMFIQNTEKFGGHGYKHILTVTCPKMLAKGITQEQMDKIFLKNLAQILSFWDWIYKYAKYMDRVQCKKN